MQFTIRGLLGFTTAAAVVMAFSPTVGIVAAGLLIGFLAAIALRNGLLALALLYFASTAADVELMAPESAASWPGHLVVFGLAMLGASWRRIAAWIAETWVEGDSIGPGTRRDGGGPF